jgi:hypothetical protein
MAPEALGRTIDARQMVWRWSPIDAAPRAATEQKEPSLDLSKIPQPSLVSPATHQAQVSRHVTIHDVAPSLPGRVTHHRVTLSPPKGEQDTISRTSVVVPSGLLGKRRLGSAGLRRSERETQWTLRSRLSVLLSSSGLGWDVLRHPGQSGIGNSPLTESSRSCVCWWLRMKRGSRHYCAGG